MNMELLRSFLAVSKYKSLSKAALSLHITQPTLSTRIKNLEKELNVSLLKRDWQGVHLTNFGLLFMPYAVDILNHLKQFITFKENYKDIHNHSFVETIGEMNNTFRIGINSYLTMDLSEKIIHLLIHQFPTLKFEFITGSTKNLLELIDYDALDMIIFYSTKEINHPQRYLLGHEEIVFVFHECDYTKVREDPSYLHQINKPMFVTSNSALDDYLIHFRHAVEDLHVKEFQFVSNLNLMRQLILANKGYAAVPKSIYQTYLNAPNLFAYKSKNNLPFLPVYMKKNDSSIFHAEMDAIYDHFADTYFQ